MIYLKIDSIDEEEDETLIELAKILSNFLDYIGGKQYIMKLFKLLEYLLVLDEVTVRNEVWIILFYLKSKELIVCRKHFL